MTIKDWSGELLRDHTENAESSRKETVVELKKIPGNNFSVKASMALELREIGLSKAAIGRVLHVAVEDINVMLTGKKKLFRR